MSSSPFAYDTGLKNFDDLVLRKSYEVPVLVDFWAAWCGPCKMLMPLLARLADEYQGKFLLAKVDTDAEQELSAKFQIRSIPTVKLFRGGQAVDGFMGVQPEKTIRAMLDRYIVRESDALLTQARELLLAGQPDRALALADDAARKDPDNDRVPLEQARILIALERLDEAAQKLASLPAERRSDLEVTALQTQLELARITRTAPAAAELEKAVAANPMDSEARYQLGARRIVAGDYEGGLAQLLEIVKRDRKFRDDAARKTMLQTFGLLGGTDALVKKYRALLASALN